MRMWVLGSNCLEQVLASPPECPNQLGFLAKGAETDAGRFRQKMNLLGLGVAHLTLPGKLVNHAQELGLWGKNQNRSAEVVWCWKLPLCPCASPRPPTGSTANART